MSESRAVNEKNKLARDCVNVSSVQEQNKQVSSKGRSH